MTKYKLTFFDEPGNAETIRLAFLLGNIPFEDHRITMEQWEAMKETTPYHQLPVLTIDDHQVFGQSFSIYRFVGSLSGLYPTTNKLDALRVDEVVQYINDITNEIIPSFFEPDPAKVLAMRQELANETLPRMLSLLDKRVTSFGSKSAWTLNDISLADISIFTMCAWLKCGLLEHVPTDITSKYPKITAIEETLGKDPRIIAWHAKNFAQFNQS